jgi:trehalose 6-phosphate phosphatase
MTMTASMQTLNSQFNLENFFARVRTASPRVLMLDYDGTLAPFQIDPARATPYPGVAPMLDAIMDTGRTRLVIVSGRWTKDLIPLLGLKHLPELWGSHGWERRRTSGDYVIPRIRPRALELLVTADDWIAEIETLGARTERKPASVAFHWRGLPDAQIKDIRAKLFEKWRELDRANELAWHDFDGGIELRVAGQDKGDVVRTVAAEAGPNAVLAYLGDDLTDEDAFKAMPERGATILVRPQFRPTAADLWIRPPEELLEFLTRWHEAAGDER